MSAEWLRREMPRRHTIRRGGAGRYVERCSEVSLAGGVPIGSRMTLVDFVEFAPDPRDCMVAKCKSWRWVVAMCAVRASERTASRLEAGDFPTGLKLRLTYLASNLASSCRRRSFFNSAGRV